MEVSRVMGGAEDADLQVREKPFLPHMSAWPKKAQKGFSALGQEGTVGCSGSAEAKSFQAESLNASSIQVRVKQAL